MEETIKNLTKAFIGESQARNRYTIYAKIAKKEGYEQISDVFLETAEQEREHAKWLFRLINELKKKGNEAELAEIHVEAAAPTTLGTTKENLVGAIAGETYEYETMYPEFAKVAQEQGFPEIAKRLRSISVAERHHEERYTKLLDQLESGTVFKKEETVQWVCKKCGYMHTGPNPPEECPSCDHPTAYFKVKCENY